MIETKNKPYYDDFDATKGFIKVLFKPGISVQTRELNQLQSIIQNQIGCLADSIFKDGSVIKDGRIIFKNDIDYVKLYNSNGEHVFSYDTFKGRMVYGSSTNIVASVFDGFDVNNNNPNTLYLDYLGSGAFVEGDENKNSFEEGEVLQLVNEIFVTNIKGTFEINEIIHGENSKAEAKLILVDNNKFHLVYTSDLRFKENELISGNKSNATCTYSQGEVEQLTCRVQSSIDINAPIGKGSFALLSSGIYYVDGYFVNVEPQQIVVAEYDTLVSAKVGFNKEVKYLTAYDDSTLYDNANGTPNENAPGADRLLLNLKLSHYNIYDDVPDSFIEILRVSNSVEVFNTSNNSQWSNILDLMAKRTYDESGNYTVKPFIIDIQEFLNENNNNGIYTEDYFAFKSQVEALNSSIEVFGESEPGTSHLYNYKYYPLSTHDKFLQACRDRVCVGINPGLAYVLGYSIELKNRLYVPMLKARETGDDENSLLNIKYGNYCLVKDITYLPDVNKLERVNLYNNTDATGTIIGSARVRMISYHGEEGGKSIYKLYLNDIEMASSSYTFAQNVASFGSKDNTENIFKCNSHRTNDILQLFDADKNILVYKLPQNAVNKLSDVTYEFMYKVTQETDTNGTLTISSPISSSLFYSTEKSKYIITNAAGNEQDLDDVSISINGNNLIVSGLETGVYHILFPLRASQTDFRKKTLMTIDETISSPRDEIQLSKADGYKLLKVTDNGDGAKDITSNYIFNGGQKDNYYGNAKLIKLTNAASPVGSVTISYQYFQHTPGDFFTPESYTSQGLMYEDIPTYISETGAIYDLKNCVDFRPTISGDNYDGSTKMLVNNSNFEADVNYYLPRIDLLEVDYLGNFKIKQGTSAINPQTPVSDLNAMSLYYFEIPSYTQNINEIVKIYKENKRFTMRDIGLLETRINAMENYILLNQNEYDISNKQIFSVNDNTARYKTGYIADNFNDHSYGDISNSNYKCSIDTSNNALRPAFKLNNINLEIDSSETNTVIEMNGKYMIPKTDVDVLKQTVGTSLQRINENGLVSWVGNMLISPSINNIYNNIDQSKQNFGDIDIEYLNEYNKVIKDTDNTLEYNDFFKNWLGVI